MDRVYDPPSASFQDYNQDGPFIWKFPLILLKRGRSQLSLERLTGNVACRSLLEKFAQHQLATTHSYIAVPDTLHLSSYIFPPLLNAVADRQSAISFGPCLPHHDIAPKRLVIVLGKHPSPVGTIVGLCALEVARKG